MNQTDLFHAYLQIADSFPLAVPFHILELPIGILLADGRVGVTTESLESVAAEFGQVLETESIPSKWNDRCQITGCLIKPTGDVATASDKLRDAYALATA